MILASGGLDPSGLFDKWKSQGSFRSQLLISRLALRIDGKFERVSTGNFDFCYQKGKISSEKVAGLAEVNERSVNFLLDLFKAENLKWRKSFTAYFRDYDSKLFYTHHWGKGASSGAGVFMVFDGSVPNFGLAARENAHSLIGENWGGSSSFLSEGLGKYAEAMATDAGANDKETAAFLKDSKLVPLEKMLTMTIGVDPATEVAYPAAGSFVGYLIRKYSLAKVKAVYQHANEPDVWTNVFGVTISQLEKDWISSLSNRQDIPTPRRLRGWIARPGNRPLARQDAGRESHGRAANGRLHDGPGSGLASEAARPDRGRRQAVGDQAGPVDRAEPQSRLPAEHMGRRITRAWTTCILSMSPSSSPLDA